MGDSSSGIPSITAAGLAMLQAPTAAAQYALVNTVQYVTPTTGQTVTSNGSAALLIDPAGTLPALTIVFPSPPSDRQTFNFGCSQIITALTITGTIVGTLTTLAVGGFAYFQWNAASAKWFRIG